MGFIIGIEIVSESTPFAGCVEHDDHILNIVILNQFEECSGKTIRGRRILPLGIDQRTADKNEMGPVRQGHGVEQVERAF